MTKQDVKLWRRLLDGWNAVVGRFGFAQTLVILGFFYTLIIGPVAVVTLLARRDLLDRRHLGEPGSAWREAESAKPEFERATHGY